MPRLEKVLLVELVPYRVKLFDQLVLVAAQLLVLAPAGEACGLQRLDDEYGMMCGQGASALGDDVGLWQVVLAAGVDYGVYRVVGILLDGVVHGAFRGRGAGTVIVDPEASADVDEFHAESELGELDVELHGLTQGVLYAAYLCDLAADVEMDELQPVGDLVFLEEVHGLEQFGGIEAEFRLVAARLLPFPRAGVGELDADAHRRGDL